MGTILFLIGLAVLVALVAINLKGSPISSLNFSELGKIITFKRIVWVVFIVAVILVGRNIANWSLGKVAVIDSNTVVFKFAPNIWNEETFAWQRIEGLKGRNNIMVSGYYRQYFLNKYPDPFTDVNPTGIQGWEAPYKDKLPLPDYPVGCVVGRIGENGEVFYIGREAKVFLPPTEDFLISVNVPQNFAERGSPKNVFRKNSGAFNVTIKRIE